MLGGAKALSGVLLVLVLAAYRSTHKRMGNGKQGDETHAPDAGLTATNKPCSIFAYATIADETFLMSEEDFDNEVDYLANYKTDHVYVHPAAAGAGAYVKLLSQDEELLFESEITERCRIAVTLFYKDERRDFTSLKITKIRKHGANWRRDGEVIVNGTQRVKLQEFLQLLLSLEFVGASKARIAVDTLNLDALSAILTTSRGADLIEQLANSPELSADIFALAHKKRALETFGMLLNDPTTVEAYKTSHDIRKSGREPAWQHFFEENPWIFGHGLSYVFLNKVAKKLEVTTTGASHTTHGDRIDALMRTKAAVSQYVLIEIKTPELRLLGKEYRPGCWAIHSDLTDAVSQVQKTFFDFTVGQAAKVELRDEKGWAINDEVYRVQPKTYLVAGSLEQMRGHDDMVTCFQLFRASLTSPEILTYDELYERTRCIVETISAKPESPSPEQIDAEDDYPF